jgi:hypothetical protein
MTLLTRLAFVQLTQLYLPLLSYPILRPKSDTHHMCPQEQYYRTHGQIKFLQYAKCHKYNIIIK